MGEIILQQALEEFKTVYMPVRNLAARTRIEYTNDLKAFIDYLATMGITRAGDQLLSTALTSSYVSPYISYPCLF